MPRHLDRGCRRLEVCARCRERDDLFVDAVFLQHALAVVEITMTRNENVVVARIMQAWIALLVVIHPDFGGALLYRGKILRRVIVIMEINFHRRHR
jgi:hypothetical protein